MTTRVFPLEEQITNIYHQCRAILVPFSYLHTAAEGAGTYETVSADSAEALPVEHVCTSYDSRRVSASGSQFITVKLF